MSGSGPKILYGPEWPDPDDVPAFLAQVRQFASACIADGRSFQPTGAIVILIDDRDDGLEIENVFHNTKNSQALAALAVAQRRVLRRLEGEGGVEEDGHWTDHT